jgi:hypothetical protein
VVGAGRTEARVGRTHDQLRRLQFLSQLQLATTPRVIQSLAGGTVLPVRAGKDPVEAQPTLPQSITQASRSLS